ncbi:hypothetical protein BWI17_01240 [Betaproteobacteria bacterium GR16-43]|nr:hypothetical protein BWI17_01240 [Betaproteobacteria bacterium GR16-43]
MSRLALRIAVAAWLASAAFTASAVTIAVADGAPQISLRIGATGGTISLVTFAVAAATAGNGTPVVGTTNAAAGSAQGTFAACAANNVRVWARARSTVANSRTATLQVNSSGTMTSGANAIPFTDIDWITSAGPEIPSGSFSGSATQTLMSFMNSREVGMCLQFRFLNNTVYPAGTYNGQMTFNLNMP